MFVQAVNQPAMAVEPLLPPYDGGVQQVERWSHPGPDVSDRDDQVVVATGAGHELMNGDVDRAEPGPADRRLVQLQLMQPVEPGQLGRPDPLRRELGGQRLHGGPVLEQVPEIHRHPPEPLDRDVEGWLNHVRPAEPAALDLDVLVVFQPAQALPHRHPVHAQLRAQLGF